MEPHAFERLQVLPDRELKDRHAPGVEQCAAAHLADDAAHLAGAQLRKKHRVQAVLVAEGQPVKQILHGDDALALERLRNAGTDALDVLHLCFERKSRGRRHCKLDPNAGRLHP